MYRNVRLFVGSLGRPPSMGRFFRGSSRVVPVALPEHLLHKKVDAGVHDHRRRAVSSEQTPLLRSIMDVVLIKIDSPTAGDESYASSSDTGGEQRQLPEYRVATEKDGDAELIRARIYAINQLLAAKQQKEWLAYKDRKRRQLLALSKCAESCWPHVARSGLYRWAARCERVRQDEARRAKMLEELAVQKLKREEAALARVAARASRQAQDRKMLHSNKDLLDVMPVDPDAKNASMPRYCPWYSTVDGCRLSECPLSHRHIPEDLISYKYRLWALENHNGWAGEPVNASKERYDL